MTEPNISWKQEIAAQYKDNADDVIETIDELLEQGAAETLRQMTMELTLCLRAIGNLVQKIDNETESQVKSTVLFKTMDGAQEKMVDVEAFKQILNEHVVESRQIVDLLAVYAMALSHPDAND
ncbi:MAG: hypothetical protein LCI00_14110 [Chloroflexi bacterium]|nr:hypothetical protein [Chloroflexota bacterium]MCC6892200.1 hypothetical protein [Anaerolineae bacterium]